MSSSHVVEDRLAGQVHVPPGHAWSRLPRAAGAAGAFLVFTAVLLEGGSLDRLAASWLVAVLFPISIALGALFFVLVQFASRAGWSVVVRRIAENLMATLPLLALLFLPLLLTLPTLYPWARPGAADTDALLRHKSGWLNEPFFIVRTILYLALFSALGWWFRSESVRQDRTGEHAITRRLQAASGPALIAFALALTFAAFDWMMSLQPHWYSTIFGVYWFSGCVIAAFATMAMATQLLPGRLTKRIITTEHQHDLGKLLFAFVAFWSYIAFSQYFLIWYAGLPEETVFFLARWQGSWRYASLLLGLGHFVVPFFFLLPRITKRRVSALVVASGWMLLMHYLDLFWLVMPVFRPEGASFTFADAALGLGLTSIFFAGAAWLAVRSALIPIRDPRLPESLSFENV